MVTQLEIAKRVGLDVSSVNKILNEVPGPVFAKETKKHVFAVAKEMRYPLNRETRYSLRRENEALKRAVAELIEVVRGRVLPLTPERVRALAELINPSQPKKLKQVYA